MSLRRSVSTLALLFLASCFMAGLVDATSVLAASPWWHLTSGSRPSNLKAGLARDEVQRIEVTATAGKVFVIEPTSLKEFEEETGELKDTEFAYDATPAVAQAALETVYGTGNIEVTGGPGDYSVTFKGELADQPAGVMNTTFSPFVSGLAGEAVTTETAKGQADGEVVVTAYNLGDANAEPATAPIELTDILPPGVTAVAIGARRTAPDASISSGTALRPIDSVPCSLARLQCTIAGTVPLAPYDHLEVRIPVVVTQATKAQELNAATVSGGGAASVASSRPLAITDEATSFGVESYELAPENEGGTIDTQAGSHPFQTTFSIGLKQGADAAALSERPHVSPVGLAKDLNFELPAGLVGNPLPIPQCTVLQLFHNLAGRENECPADTAVGVATVFVDEPSNFHLLPFTVPLFNVEPRVGEPARFGFYLPLAEVGVLIDTSVRTGGDYGITGVVSNIPETAGFLSSEVSFWGVPGDPRHDNSRGWGCLIGAEHHIAPGEGYPPCNPQGAHNPPPFLSLPTACSGSPLQSNVAGDSWTQPGSFLSFPAQPMQTLDGCNRLPFSPTIKVSPDGEAGSSPSGLTVDVHVPQVASQDGEGLTEADVRNTTVALPAGVGLNPGAADGLQACTDVTEPGRPEGQIGLHEAGPSACPAASKVGTVKIKTPLLPNALEGAAYLAAQNANPFGSLVALYVVAEDPVSGTRVKLAGEVVPDATTGQLVSTFKGTPQLPFEDFELHFFGGSRAPLATPALCGSYTTTSSIEGWSANPASTPASTFNITSGPNGSPCASPLPFAPSLTAGTTSIQAGGFSPFTMTMSRSDGNQDLQAVQLRMPPGLLGTLSSVKLCGEAQADAGTCGPESLIGHTVVSVGVGGNPFSVTGGEVFITGPYKGAPYGLSIVNPAKAGPFDLGKVIVRAKIEVDPTTAALTITTDASGPYAIPHILDGIPLQIQHVNVAIDRVDFTFNPTNCNRLAIGGTLSSSEGASSTLSLPFQATNCATLVFKPKLTVSTSGKTSRKNGASLHVKLTYPSGPYDANIARVKVDLPKQLPSRLTTLQKACTAAQFNSNPAGCPAASLIGHAKAITPVIPVPLEGPAYFVSHGGEAFPSLVVVLQGYGTTVDLVGSTFISAKGITSTTFKQVPDVPVGSFELTLPQGKFSALAANGNLCKSTLTMPTAFVGQNGAEVHASTPIAVTGCVKSKTLTPAQKLTRALTACTKKPQAKRAACKAQARRKYRASRKSSS